MSTTLSLLWITLYQQHWLWVTLYHHELRQFPRYCVPSLPQSEYHFFSQHCSSFHCIIVYWKKCWILVKNASSGKEGGEAMVANFIKVNEPGGFFCACSAISDSEKPVTASKSSMMGELTRKFFQVTTIVASISISSRNSSHYLCSFIPELRKESKKVHSHFQLHQLVYWVVSPEQFSTERKWLWSVEKAFYHLFIVWLLWRLSIGFQLLNIQI